MENKKIEIKDIPGYEGRYKATSDGRILNAETGLEKKPDLHKYGYLRIKFYAGRGNNKKQYVVHRLIALTFLGASSLEVNHKDGNKLNNNIDNLEYVTKKQNMKHAYDSGLFGFSRVSDANILISKARLESGEKLRDIAKDYNVTPSSLRSRLKKIGVEFRTFSKGSCRENKRKNLNSMVYKIHPTKYHEIEKLFFEDKITQAKIAIIYNVSLTCIKGIIRELKRNRGVP